ncbi:hypothetical protein CANMA_003380 [Candida margitis]|uniref:uncharacterized protein n=1 Tax=Candida margitis TaxID=1775924 RepID=UPI002226D7CF|nr:uncharacterized protein CANMA_003380 [Candida margitis]KAI5965995.1 hypothetical protein CANMA_003380 [Candida margitis]
MAQTPVLSYKKPSKDQASSATSTPRASFSPSLSSAASNSASPQLPPHTQQPRKISSRRKALQEFYHLQQAQSNQQKNQLGEENGATESDKPTDKKEDNSNQREVEPDELKTAEDVEQFIKTSSTKDILKLRNKIQSQLSSASQKKKEIIYDNYYELIKLSNMLGDLSESKKQISNTSSVNGSEKIDSLSGFKIFRQADDTGPEVSIDSYLDDVLNDLSKFDETTIKKFTYGGFDDVLNRLERSTDRAESNASVVGVYDETVDSIPNNANNEEIISQIGYILELPNRQLEESERVEAESMIDKIIESTKSEALRLQLNTIKSRIY